MALGFGTGEGDLVPGGLPGMALFHGGIDGGDKLGRHRRSVWSRAPATRSASPEEIHDFAEIESIGLQSRDGLLRAAHDPWKRRSGHRSPGDRLGASTPPAMSSSTSRGSKRLDFPSLIGRSLP